MWSKIVNLAVFVVSLSAGLPLARAELVVGDSFPALTGAGLVGALPETQGKVVLVDFCASWCGPCKQAVPVLGRLQEELGGQGLVVLGVSVDARPGDYAALLKKWKPAFPVVHDAAQKLVSSVEVKTMPTSFLVDRTGKVRFVHSGFHPDTERDLRRQIATLLSE